MSEDLFDKKPAAPTACDELRDRAATPLPIASDTLPDAPAPIPQPGSRGKFPRWLLVTVAGVLVLATLIGLLVPLLLRPVNTTPISAFSTTSCPFQPAVGVVVGKDVRCGYLIVPADHSHPQGPTIRLAVAIFTSANRSPAPAPLVYLGGGPGSPVLASLGPFLTPILISSTWPGVGELILLDQRGVGYSQPSLACTESTSMPHATLLQVMRACHDRLLSQGINLNDYTTIQNAEDVHDLVRALGYRQVNLDGGSYGTRLALTVMRLFPSDIRSTLLDSTYPTQIIGYTGHPAAAQRAFDTLFQGCAADAFCNRYYPHLQAVFARLVDELNQHPATIQVTDPQTARLVSQTLTGDVLVAGLRGALYRTSLIPRLPKLIFPMAHHDYSQVAAMIAALTAPANSEGMYYSVECGENMAFATPQALSAAVQVVEPESRHFFQTWLEQDYAVCQLWGVQPVPAIQKQPVSSAIPTLILAGEYDPVTPPTYGKLAAQTLSKSYFFLFPGTGHGVLGTNSCVNSMFQAFLAYPNQAPDSTCMAGVGEPLFE